MKQETTRADIRERVKTYEDACNVLGVRPMDEEAMKAAGFREDEIPRRKLETIAEALNKGWKPDWNDSSQDKYGAWFWIEPKPDGASAGLAYADTYNAPSDTGAHIGSRLCYRTRELAEYAASTFTRLYEQVLVTNW